MYNGPPLAEGYGPGTMPRFSCIISILPSKQSYEVGVAVVLTLEIKKYINTSSRTTDRSRISAVGGQALPSGVWESQPAFSPVVPPLRLESPGCACRLIRM